MAAPIPEKSIYRPAPPQLIQVKSISDISPAIRCITFTGDKLADYPTDCEGSHLKIFISLDPNQPPTIPTLGPKGPVWPEGETRPMVRTYTVRAIRPQIREIDIEFAMHDGIEGPAYLFARGAKPGHWLGISNPGGPDPLLPNAANYFMAGDPSSLPAIAALLEKMQPSAQGKVVVRVDNETHIQALSAPAGIEIIWVCGDITATEQLINHFKSWSLPAEDVSFWIAGEDQIIKVLRRYIRRDKGYDRHQIYAVPYWRHGYDEEGYHQMRHDVMDNPDL